MRPRWLSLSALAIAVALLAGGSLLIGKYPVRLQEVLHLLRQELGGVGLLTPDRFALLHNVVLEIRLPRVLAAVLIGAALATSGGAYQAMFVNPLVSPSLLGVLAGASLGAASGMLVFHHWWAVQLATLVGGFGAVAVALLVARLGGVHSPIMLVLGGVISSAFFTAAVSVVKYVADPTNQLPAIVYWLMGDMSLASRGLVLRVALPIALGLGGLLLLARHLDALSMGDDDARALGVSVKAVRLAVIFCATLVSTLTVVMAGVIGWVGLLVPHAARLIFGPSNRVLLPASALLGAAYLLTVDDLSRLLFTAEVPIGILTAVVGIPFFALALRNAPKRWT